MSNSRKAGRAYDEELMAKPKIEERTIALAPKRMINCELALALNEVKRGRVKGPFLTAQATVRALRRRTA
jgi:hypothetical protein